MSAGLIDRDARDQQRCAERRSLARTSRCRRSGSALLCISRGILGADACPTRGAAAAGDAERAMAKLTDEQRRALRLLAHSPDGCTEAIMLAHGLKLEVLAELAFDGFANVEAHETMAGKRRMKVFWLQISAAGRKALAE
jgi:hypothetical protein